ncbi:hypothetical protein GCM10010300_58220 [Streptomyces olivaceoviridis]|nr:hypothetical protein GCM10010300_58220 [Streptomyces olivaceoviridis]
MSRRGPAAGAGGALGGLSRGRPAGTASLITMSRPMGIRRILLPGDVPAVDGPTVRLPMRDVPVRDMNRPCL